MFTTYIKSLNDMVFTTSENSEEQQSPGVLGRIGSWLSPWRGRSPKSPSENSSPICDQAVNSEGKHCVESIQAETRKPKQEEKEQSSDPNPLGPSRDIFRFEEVDTAQSAHREGSVVSNRDTPPKEEEFLLSKKKRIGQAEEGSHGTSVSGNSDSHLTALSAASSSEQGVVWNSDWGNTQPMGQKPAQAQAGRRLHVYLEETSVTHCGQDTLTGQEVIRTTIEKKLPVLSKLKSPKSPSLELSQSSSSRADKNTIENFNPVVVPQEGVSQKLHKDWQLELELDKAQTEAGNMGRKNSAKKKARKNSQGDGACSPQGKILPNVQSGREGFPSSDSSTTSPQGESPLSHGEEQQSDSSSKHSLTSLASPGGGENETSCPKYSDEFLGSRAVTETSFTCVVDGSAGMESENSFYKVERKTETPESKRRSIKVSRSEVKLFQKNVPLNAEKSIAEVDLEFTLAPDQDKNEAKEGPKTQTDARQQELKKLEEKPVVGRIADKINLFERQGAVAGLKRTFQNPRSADVSPARNTTGKFEAEFLSPTQRSKSAERYGTVGSSPAQLQNEITVTVKERARNFTVDSKKFPRSMLPQMSAKTGITTKSTTSVATTASKSSKPDSQGKLDTKAMTGIKLKPDGQDTTAVELKGSTPLEQHGTQTSKAADQGMKSNSVESSVTTKGTGDNAELTNNISPRSKALSRSGFRSKRRKSKEATSPVSENREREPISSKPEATSVKTQVYDAVFLPPDEVDKIVSNKRTFTKESDISDKQFMMRRRQDIDKLINRVEALPEPISVNKDEPDTAASNRRTKKHIDKVCVSSAQKEEKAEREFLSPKLEIKNSAEDKSSSLSQSVAQHIEQPPPVMQDPPAKCPKLDMEAPMQRLPTKRPQSTWPGKKDTEYAQPHRNMGPKPTSQSETKDGAKFESPQGNNNNQTEEKDKQTPEKCIYSDTTQTQMKNTILQSKQENSGIEQSAAMDNQKNQTKRKEETRPIEDANKAELDNTQEISNLPTSILTVNQTIATNPAMAKVTVVPQETGKRSVQEFSKEETVTHVSEMPTKSLDEVKIEHKLPVTITEPQPDFAPVEKLEGSLGKPSNKHEGSGAEFVSAKAEQETARVSHDPPVLISARTDNMVTVKESPRISVQNNEEKSQDNETQSSKANLETADVKDPITKPSHPQFEELNNTVSTSDLTSLKGSDKKTQSSSCSTLSTTTVIVKEKTDKKGIDSPGIIELPPSVNSELPSQLDTVKNEPVSNKQSPATKVSTSPKAKKMNSDSVQQSSPKRLHSPRGLSRDDSSFQQDAPSSWLDVDFPKQRLKLPGPKLSASVSESNLLDNDDLDDENFIEKIQKLCAPFSLPPRKHNPLRPPQPPFAMPAIKEDHFEKTFDPEEFKFGLRKKNRSFDTSPSLLAKLQTPETKSGAKPTRVSIVNRCRLISSLDCSSHLKDKTPKKDEEGSKEEKDDHIIVKSRLEGSCILSSLTTPSARGGRNGVQALSEITNSKDISPQVSSSEPTSPIPTTTSSFAENFTTQWRDQIQPTEAVVSDSGPPFPSFNDIKLPDYLEKYLPREPAKTGQNTQGQPEMKAEVTAKMSTPTSVPEADLIVKPSLNLPNTVPSSFGNGNSPQICPAHSEFKQPLTQRMHTNHARTAKGFHKRPGKIVLFQEPQFSGQVYELYRDVEDATHLQFSSIISVKVIRGCWILYEKPDFQGRCIALEEGGLELANEWAEPELNNPSPMLIGSIRLAVCDYSTPHIDLFTEPEGHGRVTPYHDDAIETGSFGIPLSTASIQVHSGVWLVFSDPGFQGMLAVLETGVYPVPEAWGFQSPFVGSLKPLKMGGFKVENPNEVKALVFEKPGLEGSYLEIDSDVFSFCEGDETNADTRKVKSVGSLKIIGGFWVGYNEEGFEGQQYMLEEGEYLDCSDWGGSGPILSLRPILADFISPHLKMFSNKDFSDRGVNIDLIMPIINMDDTGYGTKTQSVDVISGIWVVFEEPGFCGECYILEKGLYGSPEDWGALRDRIASAMPVVLDDFENVAKFKVQLFSEPSFQGTVLTLEDSVATLEQGFSVASCKVLVGSWLAFEGQDFTGKMYLLEEGNYQDVGAMGCVNASAAILSVQTVGFEFSQPSIVLFERCGLRGKRVVLTDGCVNLQLAEGCARVQSVLAEGGMWILYEGINYRGAQILIKPGEVPDWRQFSKWSKIGSLRPLLQRHVHFRLRNRQTRLMMSVTGDLEEVQLLRIQEAEETDSLEQIWVYRSGHLHCKLLEECCLSPSGSVTIAGSRVGLMPEVDNHVWSITPEGFIRYMPTSDLVLEVKGGLHYDKNQVILNTLDPNKAQQKWDVEII
ncbi:beta/gamma crystallin domain-containing protein 1-like isoform X1 [Phyllopteryx taeniolatus]|uniref:beta/gamma crystallin domain-containing protein 1-like isoform X1 n=1 Tax=Phyllopteryx taeniolatus TaxID=161469 RepID=UPI002AD39FF5|nr:beta/gamma crystallin domain-containing protein 1-like isoform X1 [Phyllopteryx taeniolatus]